jgi:antirestriction protein ArdC
MKGKERSKFLVNKLKDLSSQLVTDPDKLKAFADRWRGGFRQYSFYNMLLIAFQCSGATICAGFNQWKKHKRAVNSGEKALWILAPGFADVKKKSDDDDEEEEVKTVKFFFSVPVFDISQTSGEDLKIGNSMISGNGDLSLDDVSSKFDYPVKIKNGLADGSTDGKNINISHRDNQAQMVACFFHELSHILLDHANDRGKNLSRQIRELEAEATSYLVCACLGIDNKGAASYIGGWHGTEEKIDKSALKILGTAEKILKIVKPEWFDRSKQKAC